MSGIKLSRLDPVPPTDIELPDYFKERPTFVNGPVPILPAKKRALVYDQLDLFHPHLCVKEEFHTHQEISADCICKLCDEPMLAYTIDLIAPP